MMACKVRVVNFQVTPEFGDFTSRGKSFVDCICVPQDFIDNGIKFQV